MPEKPEVITVSKNLEKKILNKKITDCHIYWNNIIAEPCVKDFCQNIIGEVTNSITTRGKFIVIELTNYILLIHLRMEGKFLFRDKGEDIGKHEHVELILDDEISFRYHDVRKFGKMYLIEKKEAYLKPPLSLLGFEYNDKNLTSKYLLNKFKNKNIPIKTVLLDQSIITGIGNIYDDEILFLSGLHPLKSASSLDEKNCEEIIKNTKLVLEKAIELGGTTIRSFTSSEGVHGNFQNELLVHGKGGEPCPKCGTVLLKTRVGGRGTTYCPNCQKEKNNS